MFKYYTSKIYKNSPLLFQNAIVTAKGFVYNKIKQGRKFHLLQRELLKNERLSSDELRSLQLSELKRLINYAYEYIPFYKKLFDKLRFHPGNLKKIEDIKELPILEKKIIKEHYNEFIPSNIQRKFFLKGESSGTTGSPLSLYMNRELVESEHAFVMRQYRWAGCSWKSRTASFRGDIIVPVEQKTPPFWRYDAYKKVLLFSTYHISESTIDVYLDQLHKFDPEFIYGYSSCLFLIAKYAKRYNYEIRLRSLRAIGTSSETLYEHQKSLIERTFKVRIFDWYGQFERVIFIGTCEFGNCHIFPDYGVTEFMPVSGADGKEYYELIGTGFNNKIMPLIRYRTNDIVTLTDGPCKCGRNFLRINAVLGRTNDAIVTPEGRIIGMIDSVFNDIEHISVAQVYQKSLNELVILVVSEPGFNISDEKKIISNIKLRIGNQMKVTVNRVDHIPRLPSGKFKLILSDFQNL